MRNVKIRQACIIVLYQQRQQENQNGQRKNCLKVEDRKGQTQKHHYGKHGGKIW